MVGFVCVQGGASHLYSYFGGTVQILLHRKGSEDKGPFGGEYAKSVRRVSDQALVICKDVACVLQEIGSLLLPSGT